MATENAKVNTRIQLKHDTEENWLKATNFVPKAGEMIVYDADGVNDVRFKIGDGETFVGDLPFYKNTADWNQNDPTAIDYIENRTHWKEDGQAETICDEDIAFSSVSNVIGNLCANGIDGFFEISSPIPNGSKVTLIIDDTVKWFGTVLYDNEGYFSVVGEQNSDEHDGVAFIDIYENELTFALSLYNSDRVMKKTSHVKVQVVSESTYHTLDENYIPDSIARTSYVDNAVTNVKNDLLNGAGEAYDTLKELGDLIDENTDALDALEILASKQSDWNQNDENAPDYVKNRTHWAEAATDVVLPEQSITVDNKWFDLTDLTNNAEINFNSLLTVTIDGIPYECEMWTGPYGDWMYGDSRLYYYEGDEGYDTHPEDVPFCISCYEDYGDGLGMGGGDNLFEIKTHWDIAFATFGTHTLGMEYRTGQLNYHTLDENYIPNTIARTSYVDSSIASTKSYVDSSISNTKSNLLGGAETKHNTLKKLGNLINANTEALEAITLETLGFKQSDWNQKDTSASDYIKNRSHFIRYGETFVEKLNVKRAETQGEYTFILDDPNSSLPFWYKDNIIEVTYYPNGVESLDETKMRVYCKVYIDSDGYDCIGHETAAEPFKIRERKDDSNNYILEARDTTKPSWAASYFGLTVIKIDQITPLNDIYIPDTIARKTDLNNIDLSNYYTKSETDSLELITVEDIDTICGGSIQYAEDVMF